MTEIAANNVVASQLPEWRLTAMLTTDANYHLPFYSMWGGVGSNQSFSTKEGGWAENTGCCLKLTLTQF